MIPSWLSYEAMCLQKRRTGNATSTERSRSELPHNTGDPMRTEPQNTSSPQHCSPACSHRSKSSRARAGSCTVRSKRAQRRLPEASMAVRGFHDAISSLSSMAVMIVNEPKRSSRKPNMHARSRTRYGPTSGSTARSPNKRCAPIRLPHTRDRRREACRGS